MKFKAGGLIRRGSVCHSSGERQARSARATIWGPRGCSGSIFAGMKRTRSIFREDRASICCRWSAVSGWEKLRRSMGITPAESHAGVIEAQPSGYCFVPDMAIFRVFGNSSTPLCPRPKLRRLNSLIISGNILPTVVPCQPEPQPR